MPNEHLHIMGIAGSGAKAFAKLVEARGYKVSGCDRSLGGHSSTHLGGVDLLVVSPAVLSYDPNNLELQEARKRGIKISTWQEFLGKHLMTGRQVVGICGTHGKSTVSAIVAYLLEGAGLDPTFLLGAPIRGGEDFRAGKGKYFVIEADEYNDNFLHYPANISVCVALEFDHPEYFSDFGDYLDSFGRFVRRGELLICYERDSGVRLLLERLKDWKGKIIRFRDPYQDRLLLSGAHNRINAKAAYLTAKVLGMPEAKIKRLLASFPGVERRLELKKIVGGMKIYSDYGHHPTQLGVTLVALRELHPDERIVAVFQPHMFSRTRALFKDFVEVLQEKVVDQIILTDIFPSRERDPGDVSSRDLVEAVNAAHVCYLPKNKILPYVKELSTKVVVFIGAGDINKLIESYG